MTRRTRWQRLEVPKQFRFQDIFVFVMYYIYGVSSPSLLIESTDSMIMYLEEKNMVWGDWSALQHITSGPIRVVDNLFQYGERAFPWAMKFLTASLGTAGQYSHTLSLGWYRVPWTLVICFYDNFVQPRCVVVGMVYQVSSCTFLGQSKVDLNFTLIAKHEGKWGDSSGVLWTCSVGQHDRR